MLLLEKYQIIRMFFGTVHQSLKCYVFYCSFLFQNLSSVLSEDRHAQALILKVRDYYFSERLYLLRTIRHILSHWQDDQHPYKVMGVVGG